MRAILTYHSIDDSGSVISVQPRRFAEHVRWLASAARVVSVSDLLAMPDGEPAVALTFDDAFANFATAAWPLLRDHGLPATMFVPTAFVGRRNDWAAIAGGAMPPLPLMDWDTLGRLAEDGLALGAHSRTHPDLRRVRGEALSAEVAGSVEDIARRTGRHPDGFAYPYGYLDADVVNATREVCRWACTTRLAYLTAREDAWRLPRLDAYFLRGPARPDRLPTRASRAWLSARAAVRRLRGR